MTTAEEQALRKTVQYIPEAGEGGGPLDFLTLSLASVADSFPQWGRQPIIRDQQLREFWPTEPVLASAVYSIAIRNSAFDWELDGPPQTVAAVQQILQTADFGKGWTNMVSKLCTDLFTQDNGAFMEVIRLADTPTAPVVGIAHLDSSRCRRTGDPEFPILYTDRRSVIHKLASYQVSTFEDFPSPIETMNGMQLCAVSRVLRAAQILKDIGVYQREKIAGDNPNTIHIVGGIQSKSISDGMAQHRALQSERGFTRWIAPLVIGVVDPTATLSLETIELKTLPDGFDPEIAMRWYINQLALGFGADYQDFAPLPGRSLGSSAQSLILHEKSRGRGPASFMKMFEHVFNFQGIIPSNVLFQFEEQDTVAEVEQADLAKTRGETLDEHVKTGILTPEAARQIMVDEQLMSPEVFEMLQGTNDITGDIVAVDTEPLITTRAVHLGSGTPRRRRRRRKRQQNTQSYKQENADTPAPFPVRPSDFAEEERRDLEEEWAETLLPILTRAGAEATQIMTKTKLLAVLGSKQNPSDILGDDAYWATFEAQTLAAAVPLAQATLVEAAEFNASLGIAVDFELVNQAVLDFTQTYSTEWWRELETATRDNLRKSITKWQEGGLGRRGLPSLIDDIEPMFGRVRAERIASTEVTRLFDEGNRIAANSAGILEQEWQTVRDAKVEDICRPLNGNRYPTNEGPRPVVDTHIGCRCARIPVSNSTGNVIGGR